MSDKFGNLHVPSAAVPSPFFDPFASEESKKKPPRVKIGIDIVACPKTGRLICRPEVRKENPSSDAPPHSFPPVHLSESNDSKVPDGLGSKESKGSHAYESKDAVADSAGIISERLPPSESKSDSETELPFKFPATEGTSTEGNSMHSPLYSPGRMNSSSPKRQLSM